MKPISTIPTEKQAYTYIIDFTHVTHYSEVHSIIREKFGDCADTMIRILKRFKHCFDDELVDEIQIELIDGDRHTFLK